MPGDILGHDESQAEAEHFQVTLNAIRQSVRSRDRQENVLVVVVVLSL
jgi:hypothetical protein